MVYELSLQSLDAKNIYSLGEDFSGKSKDGTVFSFINYYMEKNGKPFLVSAGNSIIPGCLIPDGKMS